MNVNRALSAPPLNGHVTVTSIALEWISDSDALIRVPYNLCGVIFPLSWFKAQPRKTLMACSLEDKSDSE